MSKEVLLGHELYKPCLSDEAIASVCQDILDQVDELIPETPSRNAEGEIIERDEYLFERAKLHGRANCYAYTLGALAVMKDWEITGGVMLSAGHAKAMAFFGGSQARYIDPILSDFGTMEQEVEQRAGNINLLQKYFNLAKHAHTGQRFAIYFGIPMLPGYGENEWVSQPVSPDDLSAGPLVPSVDSHIITDTATGEQMLKAIGDLYRLRKSKPDKYAQEYWNLEHLVPNFIAGLDEPQYE